MGLILRAFTTWRMAVILLLGFSSGIPLALTGTTLQAWMKSEGADLTVIGLFSLVGLPYVLKFLWAPLMDRYIPPFLGGGLGGIWFFRVGRASAFTALRLTAPLALRVPAPGSP